jgi:hypothetical protein
MSLRLPGASLVALLALVAFSCAPRRSDVAAGLRPLPTSLLLETVAKQNAAVRTLVGRGNLTFDSPEAAGSAFFRAALKRPDSLLLKLQGPFGMDVGLFFLSHGRFVMYNAIENVVYSGDPSSARIRSLIPFDLGTEDLVNVFGGMFPTPRDTSGLRIADVDGDITHLTLDGGDGRRDYWVDTDRLVITRLRRLNPAGEILAEMEAGDFKEYEGVPLPRHIRLTFPATMRTVSVYYTSLLPNGDPPSFAFTLPSGARAARP